MSKSAGLDFSSGGDVFEYNGKKAAVYDFRLPKKFTKDDMKALNRVTDAFSKLLASALCSMTREPCAVVNTGIEEKSSAAYLEQMPKNTMIGMLSYAVADSELHDPRVMFHMPPELGFVLIDIMLGGSGKRYDKDRPHTDIEVSILRYIIIKFADILADSMESIVHGSFHYEKSETNPRLIDLKPDGEVKLIMSFDVTVKDIHSSVSVAFSAQFIEDLMSGYGSSGKDDKYEPVSPEKDGRRRAVILDSLSESCIELKAVFAETTLDMQEVMSLKEGDIIPLDKKLTDDVTIMVDDAAWFKGKLGQLSIKKAVKITDCIHDDL
ncbi:MAG: flagellar motor switch protein FliM [Oscillospiraceae bacterium]